MALKQGKFICDQFQPGNETVVGDACRPSIPKPALLDCVVRTTVAKVLSGCDLPLVPA